MSEIIPVVDDTNPQVRAAFTTTESPLPTLGPNLGNGTTSVNLTGLTVGELYVVRAVGGTFTAATLDGSVIQVNTTRRATSFRATSTSHTVALTGGTAGAITVQQITAPAGAPVQFQGVSLRGTLLEDGVTSNYAVGSPTSQRWATDAVSCIAIGARTHDNLTIANSNIAIGSNSQREVTSGGGNVSVGVNSLRNVVTGFANTAFGSRAGHAFVTGAFNTSIGRAAGDVGQSDVNGSVQIGTDSTGAGAFTTGDNQIALGTALHRFKCGAVNGETGFWALGVAKAGTPSAPASPTYLTVEVDGTVYDIPVGPAGGSGIQPSLIDAKGDLLVGTGADTVTRLPVSGNNGRVLTEDSSEPGGMKWAAPTEQLLPSQAVITGTTPRMAQSGTWLTVYQGTFGGAQHQLDSVPGGWAEFEVILRAGTYSLTCVHHRSSGQAIATFTLNGNALTTIDLYSATVTTNNFSTVTGLTVPEGRHTLRVAADTRNASANGWYLWINAIQLVRTGA